MISRNAEEYLSWLAVERGRAANTISAYRRDLDSYETWLAARGVALTAVTEPVVEDYVAHLRQVGRRPSSIARAMSAVRSLHRFLVDEGTATVDPAGEVATPRIPSGVPKALTEEEVAALLEAVVGRTAVARRDRAILEVLYGTGMRISEAVGLSLGDLDLEGHMLRAFGKGAKERIVPLGRYAREALESWLGAGGRPELVPPRWQRRGDAEAVFLNARGGRLTRQGAYGIIHHYGDRVGLGARLTPHVLRHSCATHMLDHGADIRVVQELLGHASIATTQLYTKVSTQQLRSVYDAAHPPGSPVDRPAASGDQGVAWAGMAGDPVLTDVRAALESERHELQEQLVELGDGALAGDHYDANFADSSQVTAERGEAEALLTSLKETLDAVERALAKVDNGNYGTCEACEQPIPPARLEAMPAARLCMACASKR